MDDKQIKWFMYTVLVGLIPILLRLIMHFVTNANIEMFSASDFIAFGLILHISNINELEHYTKVKDKSWKTIQNGLSIIFIVFYGLFFALTLLSEVNPASIDYDRVKELTMILSLVSFIISFMVYYRLRKLKRRSS